MGRVFVLSLTAALNPTLLAATTLMLTLQNPKRLLSGYLAGAMLTSITCGLILVFTLSGTGASHTAKHTVNPILNLGLGALILIVAFVVGTGRDTRRRARAARKREAAKDKPPPRWKRVLSQGSARDTFLIGVVLSFPGASYIAGMDELSKQHFGTAATVLAVIGFNVVMLLLLELPLIGYATSPDRTDAAVAGFNGWLSRNGARAVLSASVVVGILLVARGIVNW
ncbi:MAG TPA: GAP family protein [Solirubrobacteraceae bacterium]|nr:GAP family protein [Solirubrobacteraceae bacterium]